MSNYTPRPGSKTEAAVDYLRANGGRGLVVDIAEAIDTDRKNLYALFTPAIAAGLMESCDLPSGPGYRLCSAAPATTAAASAAPAPAAAPEAPAKRRGRPSAATPAKAARPAKGKERAYAVPQLLRAGRKATKRPSAAAESAPGLIAGAFRCGFFSDGTLRLEGLNTLTGGPAEVTLSPESARVLTDYVKRSDS